jgi:hypothetical protein
MSTSNDSSNNASAGKCPFHAGSPQSAGGGTANRDWWPNQLRVDLLNQHSNRSNPSAKTLTTVKSLKNSTIRAEGRPESAADRFARVVAGRLGQLYRAVYSYGLARRRHLSYR